MVDLISLDQMPKLIKVLDRIATALEVIAEKVSEPKPEKPKPKR